MNDDNSMKSQEKSSWLNSFRRSFLPTPQNHHELISILRSAEKEALLDSDSISIIEGAIQVTDMHVREVMVPRSQMTTISAQQEPSEYINDVIESAHSRFPVIGDSIDEVIGILLAKDLLPLALKGELTKDDVLESLRPASFVPESKRLNQLLKVFKATHNHMAIVIDEYGGVSGLVTIEDVLEQIVGEIEDEHDIDEESSIRKSTSGDYIIKATTDIEEFNSFFKTNLDSDNFDTIGGIILQQFGRIPQRGDSTQLEGFNVKVLSSDNRTLRLLQFTPRKKHNLSK
jgi:magnesium and cobalt transporter